MNREQQVKKTLAWYQQKEWRGGWSWDDEIALGYLAVAVSNRRLWLAGDVFVVEGMSGAGRWQITGVSSKGKRLCRFWVGIERWGRLSHRKDIEPVELPDELAKLSPADPAVRRFAVLCSARGAGRGNSTQA